MTDRSRCVSRCGRKRTSPRINCTGNAITAAEEKRSFRPQFSRTARIIGRNLRRRHSLSCPKKILLNWQSSADDGGSSSTCQIGLLIDDCVFRSICRVKKAVVWIYALALLHQFPRLFDQVNAARLPSKSRSIILPRFPRTRLRRSAKLAPAKASPRDRASNQRCHSDGRSPFLHVCACFALSKRAARLELKCHCPATA